MGDNIGNRTLPYNATSLISLWYHVDPKCSVVSRMLCTWNKVPLQRYRKCGAQQWETEIFCFRLRMNVIVPKISHILLSSQQTWHLYKYTLLAYYPGPLLRTPVLCFPHWGFSGSLCRGHSCASWWLWPCPVHPWAGVDLNEHTMIMNKS